MKACLNTLHNWLVRRRLKGIELQAKEQAEQQQELERQA